MDKFRKKLARKYNELYRIALFLGNDELGKKAENTMRIIRHNNDLEILPEFEKEIKEFRDIKCYFYIHEEFFEGYTTHRRVK